MKTLLYTAVTAAGTEISFRFPLHPMTESSETVSQLVTSVLGAIDQQIRDYGDNGDVSDGDIMQALSMALAIRTRMVEAAEGPVHELANELTATSLRAQSHRSEPSAH